MTEISASEEENLNVDELIENLELLLPKSHKCKLKKGDLVVFSGHSGIDQKVIYEVKDVKRHGQSSMTTFTVAKNKESA